MSEALLRTEGLTKAYGALIAVDKVTIDFAAGQTHAIIGPNGAGKTTLINLLSGDVAPSAGRIHFSGHDITALSVDRVSRLGIGRSYQKTNIFRQFTCLDNCWLGAQSRLPSSMRFLKPAASYAEVRRRAERALALCGLEAQADRISGTMSHGEQRQLEIGMMLATEPQLLLLDEPLAGMGAEEASGVIELLRGLAEEHTLILIEHDMDAVFAIAQMMTVMENGQVLASGTPAEIRANTEVQEAYLGSGEEARP